MPKRIALIALTLLALAACAHAQPKGRPRPQFIRPDHLDRAEGERFLELFRGARLPGGSVFLLEATQMPRRGEEIDYRGKLWADWSEREPIMRVWMERVSDGVSTQLLFRADAAEGCAWTDEGSGARLVEREEMFEPVLDGMTLSPFALQMPFLRWSDFEYEGSARVKGRPSHRFMLYPPADFPGDATEISAARVTIDEDFLAVLKAELLNADGDELFSYRIGSFKKVEETWIVKTFDLKDRGTGAKTRLRVIAAAVDKALPSELFEPESLRALPEPMPAGELLYLD